MNQFINLLLLSSFFLLLFAIGEIAFRYFKINAELTRKWSHIGSGFLALLFPVYFTSLWWVGIICGLFLLILVVSKPLGFLPSINQVKRNTYGSLLFPVAVFISFWAYQEKGEDLLFFYLPVLTLAICDLAAGLLGQRYPLIKIRIFGASKSLGGSLTFVFSSLLLNLVICGLGFQLSLIALILIPFITALIECMTPKGIDNITVPLTVIILLQLFNT